MKCMLKRADAKKYVGEINMEKIISPNGVKANMNCATCKHAIYLGFRMKRYCTKKNKFIPTVRLCSYYVMADFFKKRGYKILKY